MYFVCQELNNTIYGGKERFYYWGAFKYQLRTDDEFSLNLWKAVNIEKYNRWDLIGPWKFIRALFEKNNMWAEVNKAGTNDFVSEPSISEKRSFIAERSLINDKLFFQIKF